MSAVTQISIRVTNDQWRILTSATIQTLQVIKGRVGIIYSDTEPPVSIAVGSKGHIVKQHEFLTNSTGGTSWGRAANLSRSALISVTEG